MILPPLPLVPIEHNSCPTFPTQVEPTVDSICPLGMGLPAVLQIGYNFILPPQTERSISNQTQGKLPASRRKRIEAAHGMSAMLRDVLACRKGRKGRWGGAKTQTIRQHHPIMPVFDTPKLQRPDTDRYRCMGQNTFSTRFNGRGASAAVLQPPGPQKPQSSAGTRIDPNN